MPGLEAQGPEAGQDEASASRLSSERTGDWVLLGALAEPSSSCYSDLTSFKDLTQLHQGRHSTVWSAVCKRTGTTVVIKGYNREVLKPRQLNNVRREIGLLRFFREAGCKGVVGLLSAFEDKAMIYLVFEACMRGDLYQMLMRNRGTLHEEFVVTKVVYPLLCVLQQLHTLHVVHRDIKPENIFITEEGDIALGDFGLAGHKFQDRMSERVGTLDYMAPEVLSIPTQDEQELEGEQGADGARTYDEKVDIWATGVLVYELLVGRPPFEVDDPQETASLIMSGEASGYPVHISQFARDFVAKALTKSPSDRPSAADLLQHPWLSHHFGGKLPDPAAAAGCGATANMLKSWLVASCSPCKALGAGDDLSVYPRLEVELKPATQYKRKSVPGGSDVGNDSPRDRESRKHFDLPLHSRSVSSSLQLQMSLDAGEAEAGNAEREGGGNRLGASQYPSRDSSADVDSSAEAPLDIGGRAYVRNDSGASASSSLSVASFASLQHAPRSAGALEVSEQDELGMVQRSASVCTPSAGRQPAFPNSNSQLKPVWQNNAGSTGGTAAAASRKAPGKSRFAA
ncbi:Serine/threonine-protein kinase ark1 [Tetrabaena socialis]|uniref:Serine/threonine-protein kinase ark1 n=1 Tax=Tetrabaena socialis TaxID=47790 RepID=A0A2J8AIS6_9CHLO|nr:Serine/threonine-protein kinase ark1 [Tetrabaena socialis]|eukprot:PNH12415.1 Serine/threonine-protein kinase ark1 [Tetrabaena socialis]